ncbi:MAG: PIG-L family deacetylase [Trueperaceae bacterium]
MQNKSRASSTFKTLATLLLALLVGLASAQSRTDARVVEQEGQRGIVELYEAITPLQSVASFMTIGAHPDDERSSQIALLSRGLGVRSITVTANRGEGGQNSIGTEYQQALGVLRSREMEQSSAAFNVELFFLSESFDDPILDFRFSKSAVETLEIWGEDVMMEKLVRAIRESRPDILFTNFQNVFGQHGNHRAMAYATEQAFALAGDPTAYPEHFEIGLEPWQPAKFYLPAGRGSGQAEEELPATLTIPTGSYNQFFGATYEQLGQQSRAYHRSQDMGSWNEERTGTSALHLAASYVTTTETDTDLFAGLAFTVADLAEGLSNATLAAQLNQVQGEIDAIFAAFPDFAAVQGHITGALKGVREARAIIAAATDLDAATAADIDFRLAQKELELQVASRKALSLVSRVIAANPELTRGGSTEVTVSAYLGGNVDVQDLEFDLVTPAGWTVERTGDDTTGAALTNGETVKQTFLVTAAEDAPYYNPYRRNANPFRAYGDVYGVVRYTVDGEAFEFTLDSRDIIGVLPDVSLRVTPANLVFNSLRPSDLEMSVAAVNYVNGPAETTIFVDAPEGWTVEPASIDLSFNRKGDARGATFTLVPSDDIAEGSYDFAVRAEGQANSSNNVRVISYEHVGKTYLVEPASANVKVLEVAFDPNLRVGYVAGGSDLVYEGLRQIGMNVDLLTEDDLTTGDLSRYDSIAVGIYTYRLRPDLLAANERLMKWVEEGGNLLVQYHRPADAWNADTVPPFPITLGRVSLLSRVTAADGEVEILEPGNPLMTTPNQITGADFDDWVKERGLYFAQEWDEHYTPLFSVTDAQWPDTWDELPFLGSMLTTELGKGRYTYTSLVLHTQIENNVPGAYRLYANLLTPPAAE